MYKCHRSYLVNINFIDRVEGNRKGTNYLWSNSILASQFPEML
jgi:DNA-binding LytR/AlgR family response regulator